MTSSNRHSQRSSHSKDFILHAESGQPPSGGGDLLDPTGVKEEGIENAQSGLSPPLPDAAPHASTPSRPSAEHERTKMVPNLGDAAIASRPGTAGHGLHNHIPRMRFGLNRGEQGRKSLG